MLKGVLLDLAGVVYEGDAPVPGAKEAVARLREAGLPVRFVTNSTRRPKRRVLEKLEKAGVAAEADELFTPAKAACDWLEAKGCAPHLLIHPDLEEDFAGCAAEGPTAVIVGDAGPYFTFETLNAAFREIDGGAPFLALATNRVFRDSDGALSLDAGAFVHALEYASGVEPLVLGKPAPDFFMAAAASMGCEVEEVAMIGDDAEADVAGALEAGARCGVLVRTGKYRAGDEDRVSPAPSAVADDLAAAVDLVLRESAGGGGR